MLPKVNFCGLNPTRLIIGANPFGGFSHQNSERDAAMRAYHTVDRIVETWHIAEEAGINTMITNNETPHIVEAVKKYFANGGKLQWIAQVNNNAQPNMEIAIDEVVKIGCKALYFHGEVIDQVCKQNNEKQICEWVEYARSTGIVVGTAAHDPNTHIWVDALDIVDFHAVPFFNCGSVHTGAGEKFNLKDMGPATECIRQINKPCIGYKIMGAGRLDARMAFQYAFESIKDTDVVNVGMNRGDNENMVQDNVEMVKDAL
jgi:hypothetical protein